MVSTGPRSTSTTVLRHHTPSPSRPPSMGRPMLTTTRTRRTDGACPTSTTPTARTARSHAATAVSTTLGCTVRSTLHRASCTTVWADTPTSRDPRTRVLETRPASQRTTDVAVSNVIKMALFVIHLVTFHCCPDVSNLTRAWHRPNVRTLERFTLASSQCQTHPLPM